MKPSELQSAKQIVIEALRNPGANRQLSLAVIALIALGLLIVIVSVIVWYLGSIERGERRR